MNRKALLLIPVLLLPLAGCNEGEEAPPAGEPSAATAPAAPERGAPPPISSRGEPVGGAAAQGGEIQFAMPADWQQQPPANQMRLAQAAIPGPGGPGELVVFYFGPGGGGSVEANIERWVNQMEPAPGTEAQPETFEADGYRVTWIDVPGTLLPSNMGTGPATPQPNSRLLGAVVEGPGGPWFFKATGPDATMAAEREDFLTMLRSVRAK